MGELSVRVIPGRVRVIGRGEIQVTAVESEPAVVTVVDSTLGVVIVRSPGAQAHVLLESDPAIFAYAVVDHGVVVSDAIGISTTMISLVIATVIPGNGDIAGRPIDRDLGV